MRSRSTLQHMHVWPPVCPNSEFDMRRLGLSSPTNLCFQARKHAAVSAGSAIGAKGLPCSTGHEPDCPSRVHVPTCIHSGLTQTQVPLGTMRSGHQCPRHQLYPHCLLAALLPKIKRPRSLYFFTSMSASAFSAWGGSAESSSPRPRNLMSARTVCRPLLGGTFSIFDW